MPTHFDVVVLGGGVAGAAAAIAAAERSARTCVIAGAPGATAMFSGAWRGECPDGLRRALANVGYELRDCTAPLPHPYGHLIRGAAAAPTHEAAKLVDGALVIGIAGLAGFDAARIARQWSQAGGVKLDAATIVIANTPAAGWAPASLAGEIERSPQTIIEPLQQELRQRRATHVIVPAIIGTSHDDTVWRTIVEAVDAMVGEAFGVPPSLPGWRLHHALLAVLDRSGVVLYQGKGIASARRNGRVETIELLNGDVVAGDSFVLATGKYAGGGIEAESSFREPAFGCPVWVEHLGEKFEAVDSLILTSPEMSDEQPLLSAGVHTDADHRPVNAANDVVYENVFVAGSIRAGWSVATHTIGDAAADGWSAGMKAVNA